MSTRQAKPLALAFVAVCAVSATAATAAQAVTVEGPIIQVEREGLVSGATQEFTAADKTAFVLKSSSAKIKLECKAVKVKAGATLNGAELTSGAKGSETLELSSCEGGGEGESLKGCEPEGGKLTSTALVNTLGFSGSRTGALLVLFAPASGTTLATVKFTGASCVTKSATVSGNLIAAVYSGGSAVEVGKDEGEAVKQELRFATGERTISTEKEGTLTSVKGSLKVNEVAATLEGEATLELASAQPWGAFAQIDDFSGYTFGPTNVTLHLKANEVASFTLDNIGGEELEVASIKLVGSESPHYKLTSHCITAMGSLGHCEVEVESLVNDAGPVLVEGEVVLGGLFTTKFRPKSVAD
jgi:hypothetical protein